ncbi:hypothetical protein Plec18167_008313 [Paecilomyces lecythidis]|uniref:Uncharacterized protein n=1 Tax=Paecilomyces lecythidis TaxID=3004212 RepID=A0ABR3WY24_9EURO
MAVSTDTVSKQSKQGQRPGRKEKTTNPPQLALPSSAGIVKQFTNFTNNGAGLEKTLRLVQALSQVGAEVLVDIDEGLAKRCVIAKGQITLSRRYFRFFKFLECFERVFTLLSTRRVDPNGSGSIRTALELAKWTCLGIYLAMEDLTIVSKTFVPSPSPPGCDGSLFDQLEQLDAGGGAQVLVLRALPVPSRITLDVAYRRPRKLYIQILFRGETDNHRRVRLADPRINGGLDLSKSISGSDEYGAEHSAGGAGYLGAGTGLDAAF